jgi:hypothetical protein
VCKTKCVRSPACSNNSAKSAPCDFGAGGPFGSTSACAAYSAARKSAASRWKGRRIVPTVRSGSVSAQRASAPRASVPRTSPSYRHELSAKGAACCSTEAGWRPACGPGPPRPRPRPLCDAALNFERAASLADGAPAKESSIVEQSGGVALFQPKAHVSRRLPLLCHACGFRCTFSAFAALSTPACLGNRVVTAAWTTR